MPVVEVTDTKLPNNGNNSATPSRDEFQLSLVRLAMSYVSCRMSKLKTDLS